MMATCACGMAMAQTVEDNELAMVYYMPQTQLAVTIDYTIETVEPGPFYLYAERYLGVKDVATKAYTRYDVTGLHLGTKTVADTHRAYKLVANSGSEAQWLTLTTDGMLYGYNVPAPAVVPQEEEKSIALPAELELRFWVHQSSEYYVQAGYKDDNPYPAARTRSAFQNAVQDGYF